MPVVFDGDHQRAWSTLRGEVEVGGQAGPLLAEQAPYLSPQPPGQGLGGGQDHDDLTTGELEAVDQR